MKTNPNNFGDQLYSTADSVEDTAAAIDNDSSQQQQQKLIASALLTDSQQQQLDVVKSVLTSEGSSFGMPRSGHALYFLLLCMLVMICFACMVNQWINGFLKLLQQVWTLEGLFELILPFIQILHEHCFSLMLDCKKANRT